MKTILLILLLFNVPAFAKEAEKKPTIYVEVDTNTYDVDDFKDIKGVKVLPMKKYKPQIPRKDERDALYAKVDGLAPHLTDMDALDKDMLYIYAKTNSLPKLRKIYPKIPGKVLAALQKVIESR